MAGMGQEDRLPEKLSSEREDAFRSMVEAGYKVTSLESTDYNCVAHAARDQTLKWDCPGFPVPGYYWPPGAMEGDHPEALASAFAAIGYERCQGGELEVGYEKVALYVDSSGEWQHAALQLPNGKWSSKLGHWEDVMHASPHCFGDSIYGNVIYFMRRAIENKNDGKEEANE